MRSLIMITFLTFHIWANSPTLMSAENIQPEIVTAVTNQVQRFWIDFCHEDYQDLPDVAELAVIDNFHEGLWMKHAWERVHHLPQHVAKQDAVPSIAIGRISVSSVLDQGNRQQVPVYRLEISCTEMTAYLCLSQKAPFRVLCFNSDEH